MSTGMASRKGEDIAAEIVMMRTSSRGPFIVVEGPTDERFLSPRLVTGSYVAIGSGKTTVERAIKDLDSVSKGGVTDYVGVVDEDYDWLIGYKVTSSNIVKTDPRDIEGLLFRSRAVFCVLAEFAEKSSWQGLEKAEGRSLVESILARAEPFGKIRMVNSAGPMIDLRSFKPMRFFRPNWTYDLDEAKRVAVDLGVASSVAVLEDLMAHIETPDIWHCVRGHDLVDIFIGGLLSVLGGRGVDPRNVERLMRQSLSPEEFSATLLYRRLCEWGTTNCKVVP